MPIYLHLSHALKIQRTIPAEKWRQAVEVLPPEARDECTDYLRDCVQRLNNSRRWKRQAALAQKR